MNVSVVIATRNRPEPLRRTLETLHRSGCDDCEIIVVDASDGAETEGVVSRLADSTGIPILYRRSNLRSAARQRNEGAANANGEWLLFLDDDVEVEFGFLDAIRAAFDEQHSPPVGAVGARITNCSGSSPSILNRLLFGVCTGHFSGDWGGRVIGPAANFASIEVNQPTQAVEWIPSTALAIPRSIFERHRFAESFEGYSFAEDLHLTARIGKEYTLLVSNRARMFHADLGQHTHRDWRALGKSMVVNRRLIMNDVLGVSGQRSEVHLFLYEIVYCGITTLWASRGTGKRVRNVLKMLQGKLAAFPAG